MNNKHIPPAVGEFAVGERGKLLARIAEQAREIERLTNALDSDKLRKMVAEARAELAALKAQPSGVVPGVLAECFFHALPDEDDWEVHDPRHMSGDCDGCVQAVIVSRADWEHLNSSPVSGGDDRKLSDIGNELHNLSCHVVHHNEGWANQLGILASELWNWQARDALTASAPNHSEQVGDVSAMARVLSDRQADACNVDRDDQWKIYGQDFIEDVTAMLAAAPSAGSQEQG